MYFNSEAFIERIKRTMQAIVKQQKKIEAITEIMIHK